MPNFTPLSGSAFTAISRYDVSAAHLQGAHWSENETLATNAAEDLGCFVRPAASSLQVVSIGTTSERPCFLPADIDWVPVALYFPIQHSGPLVRSLGFSPAKRLLVQPIDTTQ